MNKEMQSKDRFSQLMEEQAKSGLNKKVFCKKKGIKVATYYYWQKKLREESEESPGFQQISLGREEELSFLLPGGKWLSVRVSTVEGLQLLVKALSF